MSQTYDFSGWATRNNVRCSDGRTILKDAFAECSGKTVPLVWNHQHTGPDYVLGHALLENREEGVYAYCSFNDSDSGKAARELVRHGDIASLSIYANQLKEQYKSVIHGVIREVSLVLAGANPEAFIDSYVQHSDGSVANDGDSAVIYMGGELEHGGCAPKQEEPKAEPEKPKEKEPEKMPDKGKSVQEIFDSLNEEQKNLLYFMVGEAAKKGGAGKSEEDGEDMKHNVFENDTEENTISHSEMKAIVEDCKRYGSLRDSALAHGIDHVDYLFPEYQNLNKTPEYIKRDTGWVSDVMNGVHHTPFSKIKSMFADITGEDARAKGYVKGNLKLEEVFTLLKRTTESTTVYKKQKMDRDDIIDITDFDVLGMLKGEMRMMLDEELARAFLIGDGRSSASSDKIDETKIRPIWTDADLFTVKKTVTVASNATEGTKAKAYIREIIKSRKDYKGSGSPTLFTTEDVLADMLLMEDTTGRIIYDSEEKLKAALRVSKIVTVPQMENLTRTVGSDTHTLIGIIVNLKDYNVGADKGGSVSMFDDFDLDYNQQKYLIETRCSGALVKPYSAIVIESKVGQ